MARYKRININDTARWSNQGASFTRQLANMFELARVITIGAYNRNESRGAHYKPEFPNRDDANFLKTTMAKFEGEGNAPAFHYEDVDISLIKPRKRDYSSKHDVAAKGEEKGINNMSEKTIRLIITRQDGPDAQAFDQEFEIPYRPNMNIISALMEIRRNPVDSKGTKQLRLHGI